MTSSAGGSLAWAWRLWHIESVGVEEKETECRKQTGWRSYATQIQLRLKKGLFCLFPVCVCVCVLDDFYVALWLEAKSALKTHRHSSVPLKSAHTRALARPPTYKQSFLRTGNPSTHVPVLLGNQSSVTVCMPLPLKTHKQADRHTHIKLQLLKRRSFKSTEKENRQIAEPKPSRLILATAALRFVSYGSTPNMTSPLVNIKHFFPLFMSSIFTPADVFLCTMLRVRVCVCVSVSI